MKIETKAILQELLERYPALAAQEENIANAFGIIAESYRAGGKLLLCGNGGSCADADHIVGELMKCFRKKRPISAAEKEGLKAFGPEAEAMAEKLEGALPAISLCGHNALSTAFINDKDPLLVYAQQVEGYGVAGDVLMATSTSGNAKNCLYAAQLAKVKGMKVIAMTGSRDSKLSAIADVTLRAPDTETFKIQEYHLPIYHALCAMLEEELF